MTQYLDGPKVAAWIEAEIPALNEPGNQDESGRRRVREWTCGNDANYFAVDKLLVRYGRHISELPENYAIEHTHEWAIDSSVRTETVKMYKRGVPCTEIARRFDISKDSVRRWARAAGLPPQKARQAEWTKEMVIGAIRLWVRRHGRPPTSTDWVSNPNKDYPSQRLVSSRFGTWNKAIVAAGFEPIAPGRPRK